MPVLERFPRTARRAARVVESFKGRNAQVEQPVYVSRTVTMAPTPVDELDTQLHAGVPLHEVAFTQTKLIRKSDKSKASAGLVMPIGGEADPSENVVQAGLRELGEETTLPTFSESTIRAKADEIASRPTFKFGIPGKKYEGRPRILSMFPVAVQAESVSPHKPREGKNGDSDKIEDVVGFTPRQLRELVAQGEMTVNGYTYYAADHFTTNDNPSPDNPIASRPIIMDDEARANRREMLTGILDDVDGFEDRMREATRMEINRLRRRKGGIRIHDLNQAENDEIVTGFHSAQARMALAEERAREVSKSKKPAPPADLLKIAPYLAAISPDKLPDFIETIPTKEIADTMRYLEKGFKAGIEALIDGMGDGNHVDVQELNPVEAIQVIWSDYLALPLDKRVELIDRAEDATISALTVHSKQLNGVADFPSDAPAFDVEHIEDIKAARDAARQFHKFIAADLRSNTSAEFDFWQEHDPINEIANAGIFTHMIFALGYHTNEEIPPEVQDLPELKRLRFEAYRGLAVFTVAAERAEKLRLADNKIFEGALDSFFQFPPRESYIDFGEGRHHTVNHRTTKFDVGGRQLEVLVDERDKKELLSATRKGFIDPDMTDIFSINFALADANFRGDENTSINRIETAKTFGETLVSHVQTVLGGAESGWTVTRIDRPRDVEKIDNVRKIANGEIDGTLKKAGGKRTGSAGDRIIREKFFVEIENEAKGKKQLVEVCIYPFESTRSEGVREMAEKGYWGFAEKLFDDREGNYNAARTLSRDKNRPTEPSLYERLYPGHLYTNLSRRMSKKHVTPRKGAEAETLGGLGVRLARGKEAAKRALHIGEKNTS